MRKRHPRQHADLLALRRPLNLNSPYWNFGFVSDFEFPSPSANNRSEYVLSICPNVSGDCANAFVAWSGLEPQRFVLILNAIHFPLTFCLNAVFHLLQAIPSAIVRS
jgi:hypothetical protein